MKFSFHYRNKNQNLSVDDVHSMFNTYRGYSMRTYFFSSHGHVEEGLHIGSV